MDTESEGLRTSATPGSLLLGIEKDIETPLDDALLVATRPDFNMRLLSILDPIILCLKTFQ